MKIKKETLPVLLTITEVSELLKCHPSTLRIWDKNGTLRAIRIGKRNTRRYNKDDILNLLKKKTGLSRSKRETVSEIKNFLIQHADEIQKLATKHHKEYLGGGKFRTEVIEKYQKNHRMIIKEFAENLTPHELKKGIRVFKNLGISLAKDSVKDELTLEEAVDGVIFLKQAVWNKLDEEKLLDRLSTREFYRISQAIGVYCDVVASKVAFSYHREYTKKIEKEIRERKRSENEKSELLKKSEEAMKQAEQFAEAQARLAAIVASSDDAIISKDLNSIIKTWNEGARKIFGYTAKEAIGKSIRMIIPPELQAEEDKILSQIRQGKRIDHFQTVRVRKDGRRLDVSITISPIKNSKGVIVGASKIARDITQEKNLERQKDEFLGIASHELKTPVTSIKAYGQVLQTVFKRKGDEQAVKQLQKMDAQINKLTNLISDLLDVTKIQSGRLQFSEERFAFNDLVGEVVDELQLTTERHKLIKEFDKKIYVFGDRERIGQVIINLISNAIKYSPHSDKVIITTKNDKQNVTVCVQDFGVGIPKEKQEKVFEQFFRVSGPKYNTVPGLGLGLYISSEIVKRQGGRIWVESLEGEGSTFCFTLPIFAKKVRQQKNTLANKDIAHS